MAVRLTSGVNRGVRYERANEDISESDLFYFMNCEVSFDDPGSGAMRRNQ